MVPRRVVVTGASGFIGRHLVEAFARQADVVALARGSPASRGVSLPAGVRWLTADVASEDDMRRAVACVLEAGGAELFLHLAGHYDFTGTTTSGFTRCWSGRPRASPAPSRTT